MSDNDFQYAFTKACAWDSRGRKAYDQSWRANNCMVWRYNPLEIGISVVYDGQCCHSLSWAWHYTHHKKSNVVLVLHHWNWQGAPLTAIELQVKEKHSKDTSVTKRTRISLINLAVPALFPIPNLEFSRFIIIKHPRLIWRNLVNLTQRLTVAFWRAWNFTSSVHSN